MRHAKQVPHTPAPATTLLPTPPNKTVLPPPWPHPRSDLNATRLWGTLPPEWGEAASFRVLDSL